MESFQFNAPQFYDFTNTDLPVDDVESYFEVNHEEQSDNINEVILSECNESYHIEEIDVSEDPLRLTLSRSYSVNDLNEITTDDSGTYSNKNVSLKSLKGRSSSLKSLVDQRHKYISLAEATSKFHSKTPERFHSRPLNSKAILPVGSIPCSVTIASSPFLATKQRIRPTTVLSQQDKEIQEFQELQKLKIRAQPVNKKILSGPVKIPCIPKRLPTEIQPFNLTEVRPKKPESPKQPVQFRAQCVPKYVKEPILKPIIKKPLPVRSITKIVQSTIPKKIEEKKKPVKPLVVTPFTFLDRDKDAQQKKRNMLLEIAEQEKKNREFHAKPLPKMYSSAEKLNSFMNHTRDCTVKNDILNNTTTTFKAKPARVLFKEPFIPKKEQRQIEISEFQLHSEVRARKREAFEQKLKENYKLIEEDKKLREQERMREEMEEVAKLRKEMEYKAKPIKKYKESQTISPKPLTVPVSPNFHAKNKNKNKENITP